MQGDEGLIEEGNEASRKKTKGLSRLHYRWPSASNTTKYPRMHGSHIATIELNDGIELLHNEDERTGDEKLTEVAMSLYESAARKKKTRRTSFGRRSPLPGSSAKQNNRRSR